MKKLLTFSIAALCLGASVSTFAQVAGPKTGTPPVSTLGKSHKAGGKKLKKMHEEMLTKLNLTPEQKAKIDAHDKTMETERKVLVKSEKGTKGGGKSEATQEKLKALRKSNKEFYKETLTKDQLKEMKQMRRAARQQQTMKGATLPAKP